MSDTKQYDTELNDMIMRGEGFPAGFDKFYADDVVMIEGNGERFAGKEVNRKREQEFFGVIEEFHGASVVSSAAGDGVSFSEWTFEVTFKGGERTKMEQIARRTWKGDKIVEERFYYNAPPSQ